MLMKANRPRRCQRQLSSKWRLEVDRWLRDRDCSFVLGTAVSNINRTTRLDRSGTSRSQKLTFDGVELTAAMELLPSVDQEDHSECVQVQPLILADGAPVDDTGESKMRAKGDLQRP